MEKKLKKFGVYFNTTLIDTIEAESFEEAEAIALEKVERVPAQLIYKGKVLYEDDSGCDDVDETFYDNFIIKPLEEK